MRKIVVLIIFFCSQYSFAQSLGSFQKDSVLYWDKNVKLTWEDFKKNKQDTITNAHAYSSVGMTIEYQFNTFDEELKVNVYSIFNRYESKVTWKTPNLLSHEQIHFDIVEVYTRKLREKVLLEGPKSIEDLMLIYKEIKKEREARQELYDLETKYSTDLVKQREWETIISQELSLD